MRALKEALFKDGIPFTAFQVEDIRKEYERMRNLGVRFTQEPLKMGPAIQAVFDDTCGILLQIYQEEGKGKGN
jgi:hypothetical protein